MFRNSKHPNILNLQLGDYFHWTKCPGDLQKRQSKILEKLISLSLGTQLMPSHTVQDLPGVSLTFHTNVADLLLQLYSWSFPSASLTPTDKSNKLKNFQWKKK